MNDLQRRGTLIVPEQRMDKDLVKLELENHNHLEEKRLDIELEQVAWRSCCFSLHKESSHFFGKLLISLIVMALCIYQLIMNTSNSAVQISYSSILSIILGNYLQI